MHGLDYVSGQIALTKISGTLFGKLQYVSLVMPRTSRYEIRNLYVWTKRFKSIPSLNIPQESKGVSIRSQTDDIGAKMPFRARSSA